MFTRRMLIHASRNTLFRAYSTNKTPCNPWMRTHRGLFDKLTKEQAKIKYEAMMTRPCDLTGVRMSISIQEKEAIDHAFKTKYEQTAPKPSGS